MADAFENHALGLESPATHLASIVPSDTEDLANASRAINVGVTGVVHVTTVSGQTASIYVVAGIAFPVRVTRIWATGTTADNIVALS